MKSAVHQNDNTFLEGGGETGELIRKFDWAATSLGVPALWPLTLKKAVKSLLNTQVPTYICWSKEYLQFYNDAFIPTLGPTRHPFVLGHPLKNTSQRWSITEPLFRRVMAGENVRLPEQRITLDKNGFADQFYMDVYYSPIYSDDWSVGGVHLVVIETTENVKMLKALEDNKAQLDFTIQAAELGTWDLNPTTGKFTGNDRVKNWFGLESTDDIDLAMATDVIAEADRQRVVTAIAIALDVSSGGNYDIEYTIVNPKTGEQIIVEAKGKALFDSGGKAIRFSGTLQDVTDAANTKKQLAQEVIEQKIAKEKLEESELFANSVIFNSPIAKLVMTGEDMRIKMANENMLQLMGRDSSIVGTTILDAIPEFRDTQLPGRMRHVFLKGETFVQPEEQISLMRFGKPYTGYYSYIYKALRQVSGEIYGVMVTATEITEQVTARKIIEEKEKELRDLITAAPIGICVVSGTPLRVEEVNDRFLRIAGKKRERFEDLPYWVVMAEIAPLLEHVLKSVFDTGVKFTSEEHEMTLVRNNVPEKIFVTFEYVPVTDAQGRVTKVIILAVEVTHQVEMRKKIEDAVEERTKELAESNLNLKRSNAELEQFAYIASHDLQEPVRKISTFTQMLERGLGDLDDKSRSYFLKIYSSAERMSNLIRDVLAYSQITENQESFRDVNLAELIQSVEVDYERLISNTGATVMLSGNAAIVGNPVQLAQLFSNLMSNSLKYIRSGVKPVVSISVAMASEDQIENHPQLQTSRDYVRIAFSDNGIGFDQDQAERIFKIFQRLHGKNEFEGTGIGLSICRKIVQNHHGHISAAVGTNGGAVFNILLPGALLNQSSGFIHHQ